MSSGISTNSSALATNAAPSSVSNTVAGLINQIGDTAEIDSVTAKLVKIGPPAIPALLKVLKSGTKDRREDAVYVLVRMKTLPFNAFNAVEQVLDKPDTDRVHVALEIQKFYPDSEKAANVLKQELKKGDVSSRVIIARTLSLNPSGKYVPALLDAVTAVTDEDLAVSLAALQSLTDIVLRLPATGPGMVPALTRALEYHSGEVRCQAAKCLGIIGAPAKSAVPALRKMATDNDPGARKAAADAVERINAVKKPKSQSKTPLGF